MFVGEIMFKSDRNNVVIQTCCNWTLIRLEEWNTKSLMKKLCSYYMLRAVGRAATTGPGFTRTWHHQPWPCVP